MLTNKEIQRLDTCFFHCVDLSADITDCNSEGLELREIINKKIQGDEVMDIDVVNFSKLPCSYPVMEMKSNNNDTIVLLKAFCIEYGRDAQSLYRDSDYSYLSVFSSLVDFIRYFAHVSCDEINDFIDRLQGRTVSYFMISFPEKEVIR
ncbi:hypothetical protein [Xenorhabdus bovienii]|uniref:hypothetical protein n=1 Tax=Xenorhabdus bovienii TaxID=40576 RepID=UPI0021581FEB|nr:hypothetical protein [Xenorhabdus bovienii]